MKSFLQGKKSLAIESLRPPLTVLNNPTQKCESHRPDAAGSSAPGAGAASAHVEVVKEGDKVVRLIVNCVCGERVEIECQYSAGQ